MLSRCIALLAAVGLISSIVSAGVVPFSRSSLITIEGQAKTDDLTQAITFTTFGPFNDGFTKAGGDPQGTHATGTTSQNSDVKTSASNKISGDASLATEAFAQFAADDTAGPLMVRATSELSVLFQITDRPEPFTLKGSFQSLDILGASSHVSLTRTDGPEPISIFDTDNSVGAIIGGGLDFDAGAGELPVGVYHLFADSASGSSGSGRGDPLSFGENTGVSLSFSVGQAATAVPLPAAVWPGMVALGGVLGRLTYRRHNS